MARGSDWSREEVNACVADYLHMLTLELNGQRYSKTAHAHALAERLNGRNRPAIEFKHCNISAIQLALGYPYIDGYKPRGNYQALLFDAVEAQVQLNDALQASAQSAVLRPAIAMDPKDPDAVWVPAPPTTQVREIRASYLPRFSPAQRDYLAQEARNRSLGQAGELFVMELESRRLHKAGQKRLADRIEHVSISRGDGLGYDVLSYEIDGHERLIEVKTTAFGILTPFHVSRNELARSETDAAQYHLYRLFDFRGRPRLFDLHGAIASHCHLDAVMYLARAKNVPAN